MTSALELRQVSKVYGSGPTEVRALRDVDLTRRARRARRRSWARAAPARARS